MKRWEIYLDIIMELLVILAGALLLIFVLPKAIVFLWPFVAGWIISMMAHPVIEYLEKKVKLPKKFGSAILIAAVITGIIVVLYFAVRGIALQVIGFIQDAPDIRHEIIRQGMIFQKKIEQFLSILPPSFGKQFDQWSRSLAVSPKYSEDWLPMISRAWEKTIFLGDCWRCCKGCDKRSVRACCYVICSLYVFTGTGKTHSMV